MSPVPVISLHVDLADRFLAETISRFPRKTFGYFLSDVPGGDPTDFIVMEENIRSEQRDEFIPYGQYFVDHDDAGFMASPEETWRIERYLLDRQLCQVGVFHTHQRHPGVFANIDAEMHPAPELWHILVILRNTQYPQLRAYAVPADAPVRELEIEVVA